MKLSKKAAPLSVATAFVIVVVLCAGVIRNRGINVSRLQIGGFNPEYRIVHISDLHYRGDDAYMQRVIDIINGLSPDAICLTGDFIDQSRYMLQASKMLERIDVPVYGVPGNHEYWSGSDLGILQGSLRRTGGDLLINRAVTTKSGLSILGLDDMLAGHPQLPHMEQATRSATVTMVHCPGYVDALPVKTRFGLILSGHTHGWVKLPKGMPGPPKGSGSYLKGLYHTSHGPLYVNSGLGQWLLPVRPLFKPEITLITLTTDST
ncbi:MAG: metallophosphoesterase [bacterium]|nr:metallophosphoesterase [bacterium]